MNKTRKIVILGAVSVASLVAMPIVVVGGDWGSLGDGTWRNSVITFSFAVLFISVTWLLVACARYDTPEGGRTSWKSVGRAALIAWGAVAVCVVILLTRVPVISVITSLLIVALTPVALALLIWTGIAAVRKKDVAPREPAEVSEPFQKTVAPTPLAEQVTPDSDQTATPKSGKRREVIVVSLVAGALVAVALMFVADQWGRSQELNSMLDTIEKTESAMVAFTSTRSETYGSFDAWEKTSREFAEARYVGIVQQAGGNLSKELKILESTWEEITVLPWHSDLARFQDDYTDHLNAWIATGEFYETANTFDTVVEPYPNNSENKATFAIATDSARNLFMTIFAPDAPQRIEAIFQD